MNTYAVYVYGKKGLWEHVADVGSAQDVMICINELRKYGFKIQVSKL